jgi:hypothetical protein
MLGESVVEEEGNGNEGKEMDAASHRRILDDAMMAARGERVTCDRLRLPFTDLDDGEDSGSRRR